MACKQWENKLIIIRQYVCMNERCFRWFEKWRSILMVASPPCYGLCCSLGFPDPQRYIFEGGGEKLLHRRSCTHTMLRMPPITYASAFDVHDLLQSTGAGLHASWLPPASCFSSWDAPTPQVDAWGHHPLLHCKPLLQPWNGLLFSRLYLTWFSWR